MSRNVSSPACLGFTAIIGPRRPRVAKIMSWATVGPVTVRPPTRPGKTPQLLAAGRIVGIELIASHHDQLLSPVELAEQRRRVGVALLGLGLRHARHLPADLAALQVVGDEVALDRLVAQIRPADPACRREITRSPAITGLLAWPYQLVYAP